MLSSGSGFSLGSQRRFLYPDSSLKQDSPGLARWTPGAPEATAIQSCLWLPVMDSYLALSGSFAYP